MTKLAVWNEPYFTAQLAELGERQMLGLLAAFQRYLADTRDALVTARLHPTLAATIRHDLAPIAAFLGFELLAEVCQRTTMEALLVPHCWNELYDLMVLVEAQCNVRLKRYA